MARPDKPALRIGVIGLGMAGAGMVPAIAAHEGFVLAGAADPNPLLRARFVADHSCEVNAGAAELLTRPDIDAVYIATPHGMHRDHALLAAASGKHAIVEKPMALSLDHCDDMIAAASRHGTTLIVGHTHSFDPAILAMRDLIAGGEVGRLSMIAMFNYTDFLYRPRRPEELDTARGGGILFNQVPHQVDTARLLALSEVRQVRAHVDILDPARPTEGSCMAMLSFANGAAATLVYSGYDRFDSDEFHGWVGEGGQPTSAHHGATRRALDALESRDAEIRARSEKYGYGSRTAAPRAAETWRQPHFGTLIVSCENADLRPSPDGVLVYSREGLRDIVLPPRGMLPGRTAVLDELHRAVIDGVAPVHGGQFARATVQVCLAIQESARRHREIDVMGR